MNDIWRDDTKTSEKPTIDALVMHATDDDAESAEKPYSLEIWHVNSFPNGKGFMASVRINYSPSSSGKVWIGTDQVAYDKALEEGRQMIKRMAASLRERLQGHGRRSEIARPQ